MGNHRMTPIAPTQVVERDGIRYSMQQDGNTVRFVGMGRVVKRTTVHWRRVELFTVFLFAVGMAVHQWVVGDMTAALVLAVAAFLVALIFATERRK